MSDRIPLDHLTSDQLDHLYERAEQAEAALTRVQHVAALIHAGAPWTANRTDTAARIRAAITGPGTATAEEPAPDPDEPGGAVCTCSFATPCGCGASAHYDQPTVAATGATGHRYLSTGCLHGEHVYCSNVDGIVGLKKPAQCKFCAAPCLCPCHQTAAT